VEVLRNEGATYDMTRRLDREAIKVRILPCCRISSTGLLSPKKNAKKGSTAAGRDEAMGAVSSPLMPISTSISTKLLIGSGSFLIDRNYIGDDR
jgi:hypothetical protein